MKRFAFLAVFIVCMLDGLSAAAGQLVVIDSTSPQIKAGQVVEAGQKLSLVGGARVTLVGEDGNVTRIEGPFNGALPGASIGEAGGTAMVQAISKLVGGTAPETAGLATFRGTRGPAAGAAGPPDLGAVDVRGGLTQCIPSGMGPTLWRNSVEGDLAVVIEPASGSPAVARFPAGVDTVAWPAAVRVQDMATYTVREAGGRWVEAMTLRLIPDDVTSSIHRVAWMAQHDCDRQARALLVSLP